MDKLQGKKVLLILPKFYGYEEMIEKALEEKGAKVTRIFENRDWVSFWQRFVYVYLPKYKQKMLDNFFLKELKKADKDFDYVFIIRGSSVSNLVIDYMKETYPKGCKYYMYHWDSVTYNENAIAIKDKFDRIYTFDPEDAKKYNWGYRPLFFNESLVENKEKDIEILYLCSLHSDRAKVLNNLKKICEEKNYKLYTHMYFDRFLFYKGKYITKKDEYLEANKEDVAFKKLNNKETFDLYNRSKVIVDYTYPDQRGYSMRTIECLGSRCKIVTNNKVIKDADFYDERNIFVYEGTDVKIPEGFVESEYKDIENKLYSYYSLSGWLETILEEN